MKIYIPVSEEELIPPSAGSTLIYSGVLPVWATRPMNIEVTMEAGYGIEVSVLRLTGSGAPVAEHSILYPYSSTPLTVDLSFSSVLFPTYERDRSFEGNTYAILIESKYDGAKVRIPVVNADMTYWQMRGIEDALPQPPKIKMPSQPYDLFVLGQPNTVYPCVATPITGYIGGDVFPTTITSGKTVDIKNVKKLVISDYPSDGLTYEVDYEDRPWNEANEDAALQCALRVRWNMHNGQWYWAAFKSFFWSNKFTYLRGRGGVTEQAEITVNLEYTKEEYTVYQQLLTSSNIFASLNIDGIMQYPIKHFKLDVSGDTGARWNGNDRVYRQQVKFRTTTLQDNYISPEVPNVPTAVPATISQSTGTSNITEDAQIFTYTVTSNSAVWIESYPQNWIKLRPEDNPNVIFKQGQSAAVPAGTQPLRFYAMDSRVFNLTPELMEQGAFTRTVGQPILKSDNTMRIRVKNAITSNGRAFTVSAPAAGFRVYVYTTDGNNVILTESGWQTTAVNVPAGSHVNAYIQISKYPDEVMQPSMATQANVSVTFATALPRTGNIVCRTVGAPYPSVTHTVNQDGTPPAPLRITPNNISFPSGGGVKTVQLVATEPWIMSYTEYWCDVSPKNGRAGTFTLTVTCEDNLALPADQREGTIDIEGEDSGYIESILISQNGE